MRVDYVDLASSWREIEEKALPSIIETLQSGQYILGAKVGHLEDAIAEYIGVEHCVSVNSGTDALLLALHGLGIGRGDQVLVPANSFIASAAAVAHLGAVPVLVDCNPDQSICVESVRRSVTKNTKAVMPVHLSGRMSDMKALKGFVEDNGLFLIEDAAQAFGTHRDGIKAGSGGDVGCFSCHPLKNLNACGDAGLVVTDRDDVAEKVRSYRNHGLVDRNTCNVFGGVSRLDEIQASILLARLDHLPSVIERRRNNAARYKKGLRELEDVFFPEEELGHFSTFHTFVIQVNDRSNLIKFLDDHLIGTSIHYPIPISNQDAMLAFSSYQQEPVDEVIRQSKKILSIPIHEHLTEDQIDFVIQKIKEFYAR